MYVPCKVNKVNKTITGSRLTIRAEVLMKRIYHIRSKDTLRQSTLAVSIFVSLIVYALSLHAQSTLTVFRFAALILFHGLQDGLKLEARDACVCVCGLVQFSLVDAALAPFFLRLPALQHYRSFSLPAVSCPGWLPFISAEHLSVVPDSMLSGLWSSTHAHLHVCVCLSVCLSACVCLCLRVCMYVWAWLRYQV